MGLLWMVGGSNALASDQEMAAIKEQLQQLLQQNEQLTKRITEMEKEMAAQGPSGEKGEAAVASSPVPEELLRTRVQQVVRKEMRKQQEEEGKSQKINDYVTLFGLIEAEAVAGDDFDGESFSELNVATVELGFDAQMSEWAVGHILAKYEGPDEDTVFIDEANIWLGNYEHFPLLMTAGKFYMPFGNFETNMVQDPLTLEIGEINDFGAAVGIESSGFYGAVYVYDGLKETDGKDTINGYGLMAGYGYEHEEFSVDAGLSWVSNLADSGGISDYLDESGLETVDSTVNGFGLHLLAGYGPFSFIGEYVQALDEFTPGEIMFEDRGAEPKAWNTELAYSMELLGKETVFALAYQGSRESVELGLPEERYMGSASMVLLEGTAVTLEYYHDKDYDTDTGGSDESADVVTAQLAYEF